MFGVFFLWMLMAAAARADPNCWVTKSCPVGQVCVPPVAGQPGDAAWTCKVVPALATETFSLNPNVTGHGVAKLNPDGTEHVP